MTDESSTTTDVDVDRRAPVISHHELVIEAPLETLWDLHTDVNAWPRWRADVDGAALEATFAVGHSFRWQTAGLDITSTIMQVVQRSRTVWGGPASGIDGVHLWEFVPVDHGVLVRTTESWDGPPVRAGVEALQSALDASLQAWLGYLRDEAARLSPRRPARSHGTAF